MTYAGPVMAYGEELFCAHAATAGADGLIVPDVPPDEAGELRAACAANGLDLVPLLAPTSPVSRISLACAEPAGSSTWCRWPASPARGAGWPTGSGSSSPASARTPTCRCWWGSGSLRPRRGAALDAGADGVVIGSKAIEVAEEGGPAALEAFVCAVCAAVADAPKGV